MSSAPTQIPDTASPSERRSRPRKRLDQLAYIGFGPDSGGVLLDVSEEGLRCQIVGAVTEGDRCHVKFALPGRGATIEADGQVIWSNHSQHGGGVRLVELGPDARQELQRWISEEAAGAAGPGRLNARLLKARSVGAAHSPAPKSIEPAQPAPAKAAETAAAIPVVATEKPAPRPAKSPAAAAQPRMPLTFAGGEQRSPLLSKGTLAAGCAVAAVVALAFSSFNPTALFRADANSRVELAAPPPAPPPAAVIAEPAKPVLTNEEPLRPAKPAAAVAPPPAPARPSQNPAAAAPAKRPQLALTLPRPRASRPAAETQSAAPDAPILMAAPVENLLDVPAPALPAPSPAAGAEYRPPQLLSRVEPTYSSFARDSRMQGTVRVNATIGTDGALRSFTCASGPSPLCQMAFEAMAKWRYQPASSNGQAVEAPATATFNFQLR